MQTSRRSKEILSPQEHAQARRLQREQFEREKAERDRALEAQRRHLFTLFKMWTICTDDRCKRARACAGNVEQCLDRRWHPVVPAEWKALLSKFYDFSADGYTAKEAAAMAIADMQRHIEAAKRVDEKYPQGVPTPVPAQAPAPEPAPVVRSAPPPQRGPRIRFP